MHSAKNKLCYHSFQYYKDLNLALFKINNKRYNILC